MNKLNPKVVSDGKIYTKPGLESESLLNKQSTEDEVFQGKLTNETKQ